MTATPADHEGAAAIATAAGELLLEVRAQLEEANAHPRYVQAAGDKLAHDFIVQALSEQFPDDAVLSEEGDDDSVRLGRAAVVGRNSQIQLQRPRGVARFAAVQESGRSHARRAGAAAGAQKGEERPWPSSGSRWKRATS